MLVDVLPVELAFVDEEPTRHAQRVAGGLADSEAQEVTERGPPDARTDQLGRAGVAQTKGGVELLFGVGDGTRLGPTRREESFSFARARQVDGEDFGEVRVALPLPELL